MKTDDMSNVTGLPVNPAHLAAACDLWRSEGRFIWATIHGGSMTPTILPGQKIQLHFTHSGLKPGQIIAYQRDERIVVHRLIAIDGDPATGAAQYVCLGDGNAANDAPVRLQDIAGLVTKVAPAPFLRRVVLAVAHPRRHLRFFLRRAAMGPCPPIPRELGSPG
ncbi:MAG: S26 family signal peptidase [Capsulimonadaceae bacterium]|nr:S26 family signal peptidase [Capsulimonadaceae bacterium]